jgi:hypothetical protein
MPVPALNAAILLAAWERALSQPPVQRALTLLSAAWPERSVDQWSQASIGERDSYLLRLRNDIFGSQLEAIARCSRCGERLHINFDSQNIHESQPADAVHNFSLELSHYKLDCRVPTSADLIEIARDEENGREKLLRLCVDARHTNGEALDPASLPADLLQEVMSRMAAADPQAEIRVDLACPACSQGEAVIFDIVSFLWREIDDWAQRVLMEIHALASAYGWSEQEILGLTAMRRRFYMEMLQA